MRYLPLLLVAWLASSAWAAQPALTERAEKAAREMEWYDVGDAVYGREPRWGPDVEKVVAALKLLDPPAADETAATAPATMTGRPAAPLPRHRRLDPPPQWTVEEVRPLLTHKDPKVRTLGLVLLYRVSRVDVLPDIALLCHDEAKTFPTPAPLANYPSGPWPMEATTVAAYARAMIQAYWSNSAELSELRLDKFEPGELVARLRRFAAERDPALCTAALRVAMEQATGGISPTPNDRRERIQGVLNGLQQVPMPRRFFVACVLDFDRYRDERYDRDYLLILARAVPHEMRLAAIHGNRPIDDPDLPADAGAAYFLARAIDLFTEKDADAILALGSKRSVAGYAVAAAMLRPEKAEAILTPELARLPQDHRPAIAAALARLGGDRGLATAVNWFFDLTPSPGSFGFGREAFLQILHEQDPIRFRKAAATIVRDERLKTLGPASTRILLTAAGGYLGRALADDEAIRASYGIDEAQRDRKFAHLAEWQRLLKETADEWAK